MYVRPEIISVTHFSATADWNDLKCGVGIVEKLKFDEFVYLKCSNFLAKIEKMLLSSILIILNVAFSLVP